ncbi:endoplasmic reticulum resident protein 44-like [Amphibalanus amphitrite]|uniref:endoplasmic reticulum resident protein 44-like n=1 Tax=Amphibalanus amphitrite TaxID=1232801 RepID=UPI001C90DC6E|nr:endoplasmic reticulum resident protein 44-like [Amphibalanus amphitrite]
MFNTFHIIIFLPLLGLLKFAAGGALQLTANNFDKVVGSTDLVLINFYADWCRFSNMLEPIWDEGADLVAKKLDSKRVLMAKVDCDKEDKLSSRFHITKYPTLKLIRNGHPAKKEYRGQRSAESFLKFLEEEIRDPVRFINSTDDLKEEKKGQVIGYFESPNSYSYQSFMKMASSLKDECVIIAGFGPEFRAFMPGGEDMVIVRKPSSLDDIAMPPDVPVTDTARLTDWARRTCVPLVREITFENAEELTEEGLPFLILFHLPEDTETPKRFLRVVEKDLYSEKDGIQFLTADGLTFAHPLHHLGKSKKDLPLIAIDSFRHMYVFPDIKDMEDPVKMKQFIADLHSGKLHREFHYGPQQPAAAAPAPTRDQPSTAAPTSPPESVFKKLGPSGSRYSLLKDEL